MNSIFNIMDKYNKKMIWSQNNIYIFENKNITVRVDFLDNEKFKGVVYISNIEIFDNWNACVNKIYFQDKEQWFNKVCLAIKKANELFY